jgi:UDP-galactopyranose mutase
MKELENFRKYLSEEPSLEETNTPQFNIGAEVIDYLDKFPELKQYRDEDASYDDQYYLIPTDVFTQVTGLTKSDVEDIQQNLEPYEGSIDWTETNPNKYNEYTVSVHGGA